MVYGVNAETIMDMVYEGLYQKPTNRLRFSNEAWTAINDLIEKTKASMLKDPALGRPTSVELELYKLRLERIYGVRENARWQGGQYNPNYNTEGYKEAVIITVAEDILNLMKQERPEGIAYDRLEEIINDALEEERTKQIHAKTEQIHAETEQTLAEARATLKDVEKVLQTGEGPDR